MFLFCVVVCLIVSLQQRSPTEERLAVEWGLGPEDRAWGESQPSDNPWPRSDGKEWYEPRANEQEEMPQLVPGAPPDIEWDNITALEKDMAACDLTGNKSRQEDLDDPWGIPRPVCPVGIASKFVSLSEAAKKFPHPAVPQRRVATAKPGRRPACRRRHRPRRSWWPARENRTTLEIDLSESGTHVSIRGPDTRKIHF